MKRVVITGLGIISSIGNNVTKVLDSLMQGKSGVTFSSKMKKMGIKSQIWGNIKNIDYKQKINIKYHRFMNIASMYTYLSMKQAIKSAKLQETLYKKNPKIGVIVGSSISSPRTHYMSVNTIKNKKKNRHLSPYTIIRTMSSNISACLTSFFNIYGISYSINSACASSAHCIGHAFNLIQSGKQDLIFSGGGEEVTWELAYYFDAIKALSRKYNHIPEQASRAYDICRDGFVLSGGAGIIVVEELNHALSRGAKIYAEIIGYGASSDGFNMVLPSIEGAIRCMKLSMQKLSDFKIDYLNTHGTSTLQGDIRELHAIVKVFNKNNIPMISSTKSMTGHALGASGVQEIIYTILMMNNNFIAPSINIDVIDPLAENMNIIVKNIKKKINIAMSNSFGFGGTNATIIIKNYEISL
ncbi:3-oxoacyl-ACP synthase [Buchnera aphidicola (Nipponaphis monzeni)]|uniref:3-oxoacyl-[acyl-carrier-protein] synthase 1 n=1 Tax=Buchnera aphidicola (Nipponaphis monzeni) TaxID=2495405 RepID=A0A455T9V2_9GAMM|nr:beta-ketoacyl synthase N-terminal-like domain-containing protein [Buchnera aphidicola]BBI01090.1 3-oxoacyl-ACP synthase [Buchnera aphidicola (Nipponaphis monzeni)]